MFLAPLFGNETLERVLLYLAAYGEGHSRAIAATFDMAHEPVRRQLLKLEAGGVLVALDKGRTRLFVWNPRWPFRTELLALLERALELMPAQERERYFTQRRRPRRTGKPA